MAIIGHGIDMETLEGFELFADYDGWLARVFSPEERNNLPSHANRIQSICGYWCLKEAVLKALGVGFSEGVWLHDVRVFKDVSGRPAVELHDDAAAQAQIMGVTTWHVSISHSDTAAIASAIAASA